MDEAQDKPNGLDHQQIVASVKEVMEQHGLSQSQVARQAGMSPAVLSAYLSGSYRGNCEEVGRKLTAWRDGLAENEVAEGAIGRISAFAKTKVAGYILTTLKIAKLGKMVSIVGPSGVGKTMALRHFMRSNTNVWYVQFSKDTFSPYSVLVEIALAVGIQEVPGRPDIVRREIVARVERTRGVILCDEAQHLSRDGLETIRSIHDRARVGIAFCGHLDLSDKIARLPQVHGRIAAPLRIAGAKPADADALFNSWGLECKDSRKFLRDLAPRPGGLRRIAAIYELATIYAIGEGTSVSFDHIEHAWAELEGSTQAV